MAAVTSLRTAPAGAGKTFSIVRWLVEEFLPHSEGDFWSNLPLFPERIAAYVAQKTGRDAEEFLERIKVISVEEFERWREIDDGKSPLGPWSFFADVDLQGAVICIDEAHEVISHRHKRPQIREWQKFLGQVRHRGCRVELVTQHVDKLAKAVKDEAEVRVQLSHCGSDRDPFCRIKVEDWLELRAAFTREYRPSVWEIERRSVDGKEVETDRKKWKLEGVYFEFYDSFSLPETGGVKADKPKQEFQKRSRSGMVCWFIRRNGLRLLRSVAIAAAVLTAPWWSPAAINSGIALVNSKLPGRRGEERSAASTSAPEPKAEPVEPAKPAAIAKVETPERQRRAENEQRAYVLKGIIGDEIIFANGVQVAVGEVIVGGPFDGQTLASINWPRRCAVLSSGFVVRMGDGLPVDAYPDSRERVPQRVSADAGRSGYNSRTAEAAKPVADTVYNGDASGPVRSPSGESVFGFSSVGRKVR